jgi:hypothetical protein
MYGIQSVKKNNRRYLIENKILGKTSKVEALSSKYSVA